MQEIEQKWQTAQYEFFKEEWDKKWKEKFPDENNLKDKILELEYDNFSDVNNAFGKLDKALQICDFLYELKKIKPPQDTEKIIITTLVSCAEALHRINEPIEANCRKLVEGFFKPVKSKIEYKIKGHVGKLPSKKVFDAVDVLYLVRNDYIHNGNFIGVFFRNSGSETYCDQGDIFYFSEKKNKTQLISADSECRLTYEEFLDIFLEAFIKNIKKYVD